MIVSLNYKKALLPSFLAEKYQFGPENAAGPDLKM
jgi:hypothetical protein